MRRFTRALGAGVALALVLTACGDDGGDTPSEDQTDTETPTDDDADADADTGDEGTDDTGDEPQAGEGVDGPFRLGWVLSYLSPEYALSDIYLSTGGSNYTGFNNPDFDEAMRTANAADPDESDELYQIAEDYILDEQAIIPMWYGQSVSVWTDRVDNVIVDPATYLRVERITVDGGEGGEFTAYGCEPQSLVPTDSREVCGGRIVNQVFSNLTEVNPETGEAELLVAESIESDDNVNWTITLEDGWTFHDGTPVTASSFVDAWNFGANPENGQRAVDFYAQIDGWQEVQDGEATEMSGAVVVDDLTIEVTLSEPFGPFLTKLSDSAFSPLPEVAYDDIEAFNNAPIGNGRYQMDGEWERGVQIALTRYEDWPGENPGSADAITFLIYSDINTAYLDVQGGALDVMEQIPPERMGAVDDDFGDNVLRTETSSFTYLGYPLYDEQFSNLELRQALSLAIDRESIVDAIFNGSQIPATAIIPPVLSAHRPDACDTCQFDPERAQELFEQAGGFDGTMRIWFNSGAGHEEWVEAVANQWREVLGIESIEFESLEFAQYLDVLAR